MIDYSIYNNLHTTEGPKKVLKELFIDWYPTSILDVGCGPGTWLSAASDLGIRDLTGVDGLQLYTQNLLKESCAFHKHDLTQPLHLNRSFGLCICTEVAEHIAERSGPTLIDSLVRHSSFILFSAAIPNQLGQNHVNCQWPAYWQSLFNARGYKCLDSIRWRIWEKSGVEPWYRQNLFCAIHEPSLAGREKRIKSVIHPDISGWYLLGAHATESELLSRLEAGFYPLRWYFKVMLYSFPMKIRRKVIRFWSERNYTRR